MRGKVAGAAVPGSPAARPGGWYHEFPTGLEPLPPPSLQRKPLDVAQFYDTTIVDCDSNRALRTIVIPARSITPEERGGLADWLRLLGLEATAFVSDEDEAIAALVTTLGSDHPDAYELCRSALNTPVIPSEEGGVDARSLMGIAQSASVALSSVTAVVRQADLQFIMVAVPLGVALCGNAVALAEALRLGLQDRIYRLMGLDGSRVKLPRE